MEIGPEGPSGALPPGVCLRRSPSGGVPPAVPYRGGWATALSRDPEELEPQVYVNTRARAKAADTVLSVSQPTTSKPRALDLAPFGAYILPYLERRSGP